jgi:hypothetical protein
MRHRTLCAPRYIFGLTGALATKKSQEKRSNGTVSEALITTRDSAGGGRDRSDELGVMSWASAPDVMYAGPDDLTGPKERWLGSGFLVTCAGPALAGDMGAHQARPISS